MLLYPYTLITPMICLLVLTVKIWSSSKLLKTQQSDKAFLAHYTNLGFIALASSLSTINHIQGFAWSGTGVYN